VYEYGATNSIIAEVYLESKLQCRISAIADSKLLTIIFEPEFFIHRKKFCFFIDTQSKYPRYVYFF